MNLRRFLSILCLTPMAPVLARADLPKVVKPDVKLRLDLREFQAGLLTFNDICAESGREWRAVLAERNTEHATRSPHAR